ncbi:MAG TPA: GNAT family N-acetyltransferase [Bryobacteraceae bacterium]|jgi:GNAT superfamily N-acetyltransferase|nr:GNAT family N-acetyltransferase [Bryobacteraceae bacterium]
MRLLGQQDIAVAAELSADAGWNQTPDDWRMLLQLNPENCFGIDADGQLVSTATLICYGVQLAWIGMVLTNRNYRRRGFARSLLLHAIQRADELGVESLKLDATDQGQPLYESLGFRAEQPVERWWRPGGPSGAGPSPANLPNHDIQAYATDRSQLLLALTQRSKVQAGPDGFCLSRPGRRANYIGPCISRSPDFARHSIHVCASEESYWDLLPQNQSALALATELGFQPQRKLIRMVRGRDLRGREDWIYAIAGFELG